MGQTRVNHQNTKSLKSDNSVKSLQNRIWSFISLPYLFIQATLKLHHEFLPLLLSTFTSLFHTPTCSLCYSYNFQEHSLYTSFLFHIPVFTYNHFFNFLLKAFPLTQPIQAASGTHWARESCEDWHRFSMSLLPRSTDRVNSTPNHWFIYIQPIIIYMP